MRKKYRIKVVATTREFSPGYIVQVRTWLGLWINIKSFYESYDPDFARRQAEELFDKLNEQ